MAVGCKQQCIGLEGSQGLLSQEEPGPTFESKLEGGCINGPEHLGYRIVLGRGNGDHRQVQVPHPADVLYLDRVPGEELVQPVHVGILCEGLVSKVINFASVAGIGLVLGIFLDGIEVDIYYVGGQSRWTC